MKTFTPFKTITIGTGNPLKKIEKAGMKVSDYAKNMIKKIKFSKKKEDVDLVIITPKELGFTEPATLKDIYKKAKEQGLDLCPAETALHFRLVYTEQPLYEWVRMAMEPVTGSGGDPDVFGLGRNGDGLWLDYNWAGPDNAWRPDFTFAFRLRKDTLTLKSDLNPWILGYLATWTLWRRLLSRLKLALQANKK